ncbi:MAG: histidinol dehydrogenase [Nitriliruptorales bacterium]|nr:histidinol dehydrogenase [Nitriliruptorales bacterium]
MLRVIDLRGDSSDPREHFPRPATDRADVAAAVNGILDDVLERGDAAVRELTQKFDGVELDDFLVPEKLRAAALDELDEDLRAALERAVDQVRWFHERARPDDWEDARGGARMGQWHRPVQRAGIYVPGGKAAYPSTVVMTVVPAQVAGVDDIVLCTPPTGDGGQPNRTILAAAELLGVDRVYRVGGAQAIAAMAYGTDTIPACDTIVGPGNVFVTQAKQRVQGEGRCSIDAVAGPTEIAIVADHTADSRLLAADLVAQAEHDELATCLLITTDESHVEGVAAALEDEVSRTRHRSRVQAALDGQGTVMVVDDIDRAIEVAEAFAAEHLEVHTEDANKVAASIRYAGTTFIGPQTPVSLGDYAAGPNHTLPTSGTARFNGGLSTTSFLVPVNWVAYDEEALADLAPTVDALAAAEDLPAHARAVQIRLEPGERA